MFVDFVVYMGNQNLFAVVTVLFELTEFGNVIASTRILIQDFHQDVALYYYVFDYLVYGFAAVLILIDVVTLTLNWRKYFGDGFGWRIMSWLNYSLFIAA